MIKQLQLEKRDEILDYFHENRRDHRSQFSVWQDIQAKNIYSSEFLLEKMDYIHNNPMMKKWNLVNDRAEYLYSSARYYDLGITPSIEVNDIQKYLEN